MDGAFVKKGDLLFEIDPKPFQAAVAQAQAQAQGRPDEAKSRLDLAKQEFARASVLVESGAIAKSLYDQRSQPRKAGQATVLVAQGALDRQS